jgi:hypothetical protein
MKKITFSVKDQIGSVCAQLIHIENQIKDEPIKDEIGAAVAQLIRAENQMQ